jgi:hypothetical protein
VFLFQGKMIEVVFYIKCRLKGQKIEGALFFYRLFGVWLMSLMAIVWEMVIFLGPIISPQTIDYRVAYFTHIITSSLLAFTVTFSFSLRVRNIMANMEISNSIYAEVRSKLDYLLKNAVVFCAWTIPVCIVAIKVEAVMRWNMILFFLFWITSENFVLVLLFGSSPVQESGDSRKTTEAAATSNSHRSHHSHADEHALRKETISSSGLHDPHELHEMRAASGSMGGMSDPEAVPLAPSSHLPLEPPSPSTSATLPTSHSPASESPPRSEGPLIFNPYEHS